MNGNIRGEIESRIFDGLLDYCCRIVLYVREGIYSAIESRIVDTIVIINLPM